jgi:hypothetical protein
MTMFWGLFWLAFIILPILYLISRNFKHRSDSDGRHQNNSLRIKFVIFLNRIWGKSEDLIPNIVFGIMVTVLIILIDVAVQAPWDLGLVIAGLILSGGAAAFLYLASLYKIFEHKPEVESTSIVPVGLATISISMLLVMLVLTLIRLFSDKPLWFSIHYIWIPVILAPLAWGIRSLVDEFEYDESPQTSILFDEVMTNPTKYPKSDPLSPWAILMGKERKRFDSGRYIPENDFFYLETAKRIQEMIAGNLLRPDDFSEAFFYATERLLLARIHGQRITITIPGVHFAVDELYKTANQVYVYLTEKNKTYNLHPEIQEALTIA